MHRGFDCSVPVFGTFFVSDHVYRSLFNVHSPSKKCFSCVVSFCLCVFIMAGKCSHPDNFRALPDA